MIWTSLSRTLEMSCAINTPSLTTPTITPTIAATTKSELRCRSTRVIRPGPDLVISRARPPKVGTIRRPHLLLTSLIRFCFLISRDAQPGDWALLGSLNYFLLGRVMQQYCIRLRSSSFDGNLLAVH